MDTITVYGDAQLNRLLDSFPYAVVFYTRECAVSRMIKRELRDLQRLTEFRGLPVLQASERVLSRDYLNRRQLLQRPAIGFFVGHFEVHRQLGPFDMPSIASQARRVVEMGKPKTVFNLTVLKR